MSVVEDGTFFRLGRMLGGKYRTAKWLWASVAGSETEAIRTEHAVGREMAAAIREQASGDTDPDVQALLEALGERLAGSVRNRQYRFQVMVLPSDQPSAFALPGGFIFVTGSLVELCGRDRDEMAFVVGHEMAHVIRRHAVDRLLRQKAISAASLASPARGWIAPWIRKVGLHWLERAHSRDEEFEADELGALLMRAAGFETAGSVRLLERFGSLDARADRPGLGDYFSTHPPVHERVRNLQRRLKPE